MLHVNGKFFTSQHFQSWKYEFWPKKGSEMTSTYGLKIAQTIVYVKEYFMFFSNLKDVQA